MVLDEFGPGMRSAEEWEEVRLSRARTERLS